MFLDPFRLPQGSPFRPSDVMASTRSHVHHFVFLHCFECEKVGFLAFCHLSLPFPVVFWWLQSTVVARSLLAWRASTSP
jgi:hypothetical protein